MKKKSLLSTALLLLLTSISIIVHAQSIEIQGQLKGLANGTVMISYKKNEVFKEDTVIGANDNFTWKLNSFEPQIISLIINNNGYSFFAQPGHIIFTGIKGSMQSYKITGSPMQADAEAFSASVQDLADQQNPFFSRLNTASKEEKAALVRKIDSLKREIKLRADQFIASHPKSFYSLYMVAGRISWGYSEVKTLYDGLDNSIKQSEPGKKLAQKLELLKKSRIGTLMADFTQPDTNGRPVKFSSFKGKYVLVDFWASWCGPCRAEMPNVLRVYNTYKNKGFTVVGISLDNKAANWKKAIRDDKMPWTQLSDLKGWKNEVSASFGIEGIPSNLLVDPTGRIIGKDLIGAALEEKLKQLLN